jgi:hypothetical protein
MVTAEEESSRVAEDGAVELREQPVRSKTENEQRTMTERRIKNS